MSFPLNNWHTCNFANDFRSLSHHDLGSQSNFIFSFHSFSFRCFLFFILSFLNIFIDYAITVVPFPPPHSTPSCPPPPTFTPYSSCPWVILISSLASTFPTLFLPSPCLFSTYHLCYLFSVPLTPSPPPTPLLTTLMF